MKKYRGVYTLAVFARFTFLALFCLQATNLCSQAVGVVLENQDFESRILTKKVHYSVYLPPDYNSAVRSYPVVYLLHGFTDDNTAWIQFGEINRLADHAILSGTIPPMIIVMPNGDSSFFINSYDGKEKYEDFFVQEFIPAVERIFRIKTEKKYRGIAGLSMGGYGALILALKHPDLFAASAPLSAAVWDDEAIITMSQEDYDAEIGKLFGLNLKGSARITKTWQANSILKIVSAADKESLQKVRYWIDSGDDDFLTWGNCQLDKAFMEKSVPHEFRVRDGSHNWTYWRTGITDALQFIGQSFR